MADDMVTAADGRVLGPVAFANGWTLFPDDDVELRRIRARFSLSWDASAFANELEEYWKRGPGAARIRWGTDGDFTRCARALDKHVGNARAKRICAQWHKDMNGFWPGDKRNQ